MSANTDYDDNEEYDEEYDDDTENAQRSVDEEPFIGRDWEPLCQSIAKNGGTLMQLRKMIISNVNKRNLEKVSGELLNLKDVSMSEFRVKVYAASKAQLCKALARYYVKYSSRLD